MEVIRVVDDGGNWFAEDFGATSSLEENDKKKLFASAE